MGSLRILANFVGLSLSCLPSRCNQLCPLHVISYVHKGNRASLFKQKLLSLYRLDSKHKLLSPWIWQSPVHHVVGKYKIILCSVICAMTTIARKSVTMTLIKSSGKNIN